MLIHWIWLATRRNLGDHGKGALLERLHSPEAIYKLTPAQLREIPDLTKKAAESLLDKSLSESEEILSRCLEKRISILTLQDAAYPSRLKNIYDPPVVLYYKGQLPDLEEIPVIGVVGTRKASAYGLITARRMGEQLARHGAAVVSGVATGIDAESMLGALQAGGRLIGVLGCGVDVVYPRENRALYADTERYGCLLTEFPPGTPPIGSNFPRRNRIISGLSNGILVVEAPEKSGALITARRAAEQGRDVFTVPGNIDNPAGKGSNQLLKDGAIPVSSGWEVLEEYVHLYPQLRHRDAQNSPPAPRNASEKQPLLAAQKPRTPGRSKPKTAPETKKVIDKTESTPYIDLNEIESSLTPAEKTIAGLLTGGQKLVDDIIADSGLNTGAVLASLTLLEVKGVVRRLPGRLYELKRRN